MKDYSLSLQVIGSGNVSQPLDYSIDLPDPFVAPTNLPLCPGWATGSNEVIPIPSKTRSLLSFSRTVQCGAACYEYQNRLLQCANEQTALFSPLTFDLSKLLISQNSKRSLQSYPSHYFKPSSEKRDVIDVDSNYADEGLLGVARCMICQRRCAAINATFNPMGWPCATPQDIFSALPSVIPTTLFPTGSKRDLNIFDSIPVTRDLLVRHSNSFD